MAEVRAGMTEPDMGAQDVDALQALIETAKTTGARPRRLLAAQRPQGAACANPTQQRVHSHRVAHRRRNDARPPPSPDSTPVPRLHGHHCSTHHPCDASQPCVARAGVGEMAKEAEAWAKALNGWRHAPRADDRAELAKANARLDRFTEQYQAALADFERDQAELRGQMEAQRRARAQGLDPITAPARPRRTGS